MRGLLALMTRSHLAQGGSLQWHRSFFWSRRDFAKMLKLSPDGGIGRHTGLKIRALPKKKNQPPQRFLTKSLFSLPFCNPSHSAHSAQARYPVSFLQENADVVQT